MKARYRFPFLIGLIASWTCWGSAAAAEEHRAITGQRVELGELVQDAPDDLLEIDIAEAPPPGQSRLLTRNEVIRAIEKAGFAPEKVRLAHVYRVLRPSEQWTTKQIERLARPALQQALPDGVQLQRVSAQLPLVVAPGSVIGRARLPKLPKRPGPFKTTAMLELLEGDEVVRVFPISTIVYIDQRAARPDVLRGAPISVFIKRRSATISAQGQALSDADIGDVIQVRVTRTNKVVRAEVQSTRTARIVEGD